VGDNKKVANGVVALSSAAVLAIYGTGYARTRAAADRFAEQAAGRRPHIPAARDDRDAAAALELTASAPAPEPIPANDTSAADAPIQRETRAIAVVELNTQPAVAPNREVEPTRQPAVAKETAVEKGAAPAGDETPAAAEAAPSAEAQITPVPAPAPVAPAPPADTAKGLYKDGTYYGWGTSRHGDIQAAVVVESGRITVARVERCLTRYSCNWITPIPPRILLKQGTTYDYVSGATESSDAFQDAVSEALSQAK